MNEPIRYFVTEGAGETVVHPLGLAMLLICGLLFLQLPRRYALWPFIVMVCFVSSRQCVAIGTFNLYFTRLFYLFLLPARILFRGENRGFRLNALDWTVIAYGIGHFVAGALNWDLNLIEMKTRSGYAVDILGSYFIFRILIRNIEDVRSVVRCLALVSVPLLAFFAVEFATGRNLFSIFGGVPEITPVREGRLRCQGAFGHSILAGTIWASFLPLFIYGALKMGRYRWLMVAGCCSAVGIVFLSASSTPLMGVMVVLAGWALYRFRAYARTGFATAALLLLALHMVMKAPVWHLIARLNVTGGNSGYHRFAVIDGFINHWDEWWLWGSKVGTAHWGHFTFDVADQFVMVGVTSGVFVLAIFIAVIVLALFAAGRIGRQAPFWGWMLGVQVLTLCVCFLGISIWGQLHFAWSMPLAMIGSRRYLPRVTVQVRTSSANGRDRGQVRTSHGDHNPVAFDKRPGDR